MTTAPPTHPLGLKLIIVGRRKPGTTLAEHRQHIRHVHGEQVLRYIAIDPANAPRRYAQNQVFDSTFRATAPGTDPFALNRDFVTEIWFPDVPALQRSRQTDFYLTQLQGDEDNFVDQATVVFMPSRERTIVSHTAPTVGSTKLFVMLQRAPGVEPEAFQRAWRSAAEALASMAAALNVQRYIQNDPLPGPAGAPPLDGIDEFWLDDEASARALLTQWQGGLAEHLVQPGLMKATGHFALLASEQLLHAGVRGS